jgi:hypothetical protein
MVTSNNEVTEQWDYNQRQYQLMKQFITDFEAGTLNIRALIDSLNALLNVLQGASQEWKSSFNAEWWTLEEVYAVALDRGKTRFSQEDEDLIFEAITNMRRLLEEVMAKDI